MWEQVKNMALVIMLSENGLKITIKIMSLSTIEKQLEEHYDGIFRNIWVQGTTRSFSKDVLITLFHPKGYEMVSAKNLKDISFEEILKVLEKNSVVNRILEEMCL